MHSLIETHHQYNDSLSSLMSLNRSLSHSTLNALFVTNIILYAICIKLQSSSCFEVFVCVVSVCSSFFIHLIVSVWIYFHSDFVVHYTTKTQWYVTWTENREQQLFRIVPFESSYLDPFSFALPLFPFSLSVFLSELSRGDERWMLEQIKMFSWWFVLLALYSTLALVKEEN